MAENSRPCIISQYWAGACGWILNNDPFNVYNQYHICSVDDWVTQGVHSAIAIGLFKLTQVRYAVNSLMPLVGPITYLQWVENILRNPAASRARLHMPCCLKKKTLVSITRRKNKHFWRKKIVVLYCWPTISYENRCRCYVLDYCLRGTGNYICFILSMYCLHWVQNGSASVISHLLTMDSMRRFLTLNTLSWTRLPPFIYIKSIMKLVRLLDRHLITNDMSSSAS